MSLRIIRDAWAYVISLRKHRKLHDAGKGLFLLRLRDFRRLDGQVEQLMIVR